MLTVGDIADKIAHSPQDRATVHERLRHWTREGLIPVIGEKRPGPGHHKRYAESSVYIAAVLNILANRGVTVGQVTRARLEPPGDSARRRPRPREHQDPVITLANQALTTWQQAPFDDPVVFLILATNPDGRTWVYLEEIKKTLFEEHSGGIAPIHAKADSSLVINLTKVFINLSKEGG